MAQRCPAIVSMEHISDTDTKQGVYTEKGVNGKIIEIPCTRLCLFDPFEGKTRYSFTIIDAHGNTIPAPNAIRKYYTKAINRRHFIIKYIIFWATYVSFLLTDNTYFLAFDK